MIYLPSHFIDRPTARGDIRNCIWCWAKSQSQKSNVWPKICTSYIRCLGTSEKKRIVIINNHPTTIRSEDNQISETTSHPSVRYSFVAKHQNPWFSHQTKLVAMQGSCRVCLKVPTIQVSDHLWWYQWYHIKLVTYLMGYFIKWLEYFMI